MNIEIKPKVELKVLWKEDVDGDYDFLYVPIIETKTKNIVLSKSFSTHDDAMLYAKSKIEKMQCK